MDQEGLQSPRSDCAPSYPFAQGVDSRLMPSSAPDMDSDDNPQEEDEEEEEGEEMVVAMGYGSVDEDCNLNFFDVSKVSETSSSSSFSISSLAAAQPIEGDAGSYIDSDEHEQVTAGLVHWSSAVAVHSGSTVVQQNSCLSPCPLSPARLLTVFSPPSLADHHRRLNFSNIAEAIQQGVDAASNTNTYSPHGLARNVPSPVSASGIYPSSTGFNLGGEAEGAGLGLGLGVVEERLIASSTVGIDMEMNMEVTGQEEGQDYSVLAATAGADIDQDNSCSNSNIDFCSYSLRDSAEAEGMSETKDTAAVDAIEGQSESSVPVKPSVPVSVPVSVSTAASPLIVISRSATYIGNGNASDKDKDKDTGESGETKGGDSTPSKGTDRLSYPVPVPYPPSASSRPSSAAAASSSSSSSSSGVLAGLRNFRMQWGGAQGTSTSTSTASTPAHTPTPPCITAGSSAPGASPILLSGRKTVSVALNGFSVAVSPSAVTDKDR